MIYDKMNDSKNDSDNYNDNDNHNDNDEKSQRMKQTSKVPPVPPSRVFAAHAPVQWMYPTSGEGILDTPRIQTVKQEYVCTSGHFTELLKMVIYTGFSIDIYTHMKMTIFNSNLDIFLGK